MIFNHFDQDLKRIGSLEKSLLLRLLISGIGVLFLTWLSVLIEFGRPTFSHEIYYWAGLTLTTPILYFTGLPFFRSLFAPHSLRFSIDIPLLIALVCGYAYSLHATLFPAENLFAYFDSILIVLFIVYAGRYLEIFCRRRIGRLAQNLSAIPSTQVKVIKADNQFHSCELKDIVIGDILYIGPGEYFPVDGIILESDTSVDESMITGEAHAVPKFTHEVVRAGTCNLDKAITIRATSTFHHSYFGKILATLQQALPNKDKEASPSDPIALWHQMIALTCCGAIYCWWLPFDHPFALFCAACAILITCPCTIAIAYPLTCACVLEICVRKGILIKNPSAFFKFSEVEHILFDKTGTLTEGNLIVAKAEFFNGAKPEEALPLISVIEQNTHHPIAHAIVQYCKARYPELQSANIQRLRVFPGKGVRAIINGRFTLIGSSDWLRKNGIFVPADVIAEQETQIHSDLIFVHCAIDGLEVARIHLKDKIRKEAAEVIHFLKQRNIEMTVLSGDRPAIVNAIASQLGPIIATASAMPQDKEAQVALLQDQGNITAMVGDGLNDAPALKRADIGIGIGTGNAISIASSDIILQYPELTLIKDCLLLSIAARKILRQNHLLGLGFCLLMLPFAALGQLTPLMMLTSFCLSALIVMANTARLKFFRFSPIQDGVSSSLRELPI
ncbi:MAG: heavy metal translocating P-type ATPase [Candidatus Berkiella sp.]